MVSDEVIRERDGNRCARDGSTDRLDVHHRWLRSAGRDERPCNRVTLCRRCHDWVHAHPLKAQEEGWLVTRTLDPAEVQVSHVLWPAYPVWLADDEHASIRLI